MVNIYELDEEQLKEYANSQSEEAQQSSRIDEAIESFKYINELYRTREKDFGKILKLLRGKNFDDVYNACADLGIQLDRLSTRVKMYPFEIGEKSSDKKIRLNKANSNGKKLSFYRNNFCLRVIMPELLPHKQQYDNSTGKMKYYYDIDSFKATYYEQFLREFESGKYRLFSEKVSICYIMHISQSMKGSVFDTDNYDTKVMTDIIATFLLHDDNFLCCNYFVDIVVDDNCREIEDAYTDIIVCASDRREKILKSLK